jgi:hypothetical protein
MAVHISSIEWMRAAVQLWLLLVPLFAFPAHANGSNCYSIRDADRKNVCLALANRQASYCYSVRQSDAKNMCLAQAGNQKSYCYSIRNNDARNHCLAMVR